MGPESTDALPAAGSAWHGIHSTPHVVRPCRSCAPVACRHIAGQLQTMSLDAVYAAETQSLTGTMRQLGQVVQQAAAAFQRLSQQVWLWCQPCPCLPSMPGPSILTLHASTTPAHKHMLAGRGRRSALPSALREMPGSAGALHTASRYHVIHLQLAGISLCCGCSVHSACCR